MKLNEIIKSSGLSDEKQLALKSSFEEYAKTAEEWKAKADLIVIKDENDLGSMKEADNARKILKTKRVEVEHKRKELKEASLKEGKLIDSVANLIKGLIEPIETSLLEKSKFAENLRKEKEEALRVKRNAEIDPLSEFVPYDLDFGVMPEEEYLKVLNGAKLQLEQKLEAEREIVRLENERKKRELEIEREKAMKIQEERDELIRRQQEEEEERLRIQREEEEAKILEEERIKNASDKEKLIIFRDQLRAVKKPNVDSEKAIDLLISIRHELVNIYQIIDDFEVV